MFYELKQNSFGNKFNLKRVLVTDCGSTTTKALLFEKTKDGWRKTFRGESPTTVEKPVEDVTVGAINAFKELEEVSGLSILEASERCPLKKGSPTDKNNIDCYLSTSSAGGGLQMAVMGAVKKLSANVAERAALGAGAIVLDTFSFDDGREDFEKVEKLRYIKPDMVLLSGGTEGGSKLHAMVLAEILVSASPAPRFGNTLKLPVIYAGNSKIKSEIIEVLQNSFEVTTARNLYPEIGKEDISESRDIIHELFLTHVMSHSPGYDKLLSWADSAILPTPSAVGNCILSYAKETNKNIICVDIGGATTDVFSVVFNNESPNFHRSVSANFGMSYSIGNVLQEAGVANIKRWLSFDITDNEIKNRIFNKMCRPTSIPQTEDDLNLEQAVCREALKLSTVHHFSLLPDKNISGPRTISAIFSQNDEVSKYKMLPIDIVVGSGGVLSHAPKRIQSAHMMIDGLGLVGITEITVDSIFMLPHIGAFAELHPAGAKEILENDCLIKVCHHIRPIFGKKLSGIIGSIDIKGKGNFDLEYNKVCQIELSPDESYEITCYGKNLNFGSGFSVQHKKTIIANLEGVIIDGRELIC